MGPSAKEQILISRHLLVPVLQNKVKHVNSPLDLCTTNSGLKADITVASTLCEARQSGSPSRPNVLSLLQPPLSRHSREVGGVPPVSVEPLASRAESQKNRPPQRSQDLLAPWLCSGIASLPAVE